MAVFDDYEAALASLTESAVLASEKQHLTRLPVQWPVGPAVECLLDDETHLAQPGRQLGRRV